MSPSTLRIFQFVVIHTVKGFGIINEAEVVVFLEFSCFFYDPADVGNLISGSSAFSKPSLAVWKFLVYINLKEMGIPDHLTSLLRNLHVSQEATVRTRHEQHTGSKLGKENVKAV